MQLTTAYLFSCSVALAAAENGENNLFSAMKRGWLMTVFGF